MLKVDSPQPPMDMPPQPPMMQDMGDGNEMSNQMTNDMPPQPPMMQDMGDGNEMSNDFDTNFDAGVDANEEIDPKKYIQQLTGKLSQSLRNYNNEQQQPDTELSKYVCGMIVKQAIEGLNQNDVDDILKKIKSDEDDIDVEQPPMNDDGNDIEQQQESINRKQKIDEIFQDLIDTEEDEIEKPLKKNNSFRKKPFTSPSFN